MSAPLLLAVGLLGGAGALARFLVDRATSTRARPTRDPDGRPFPLGILVVNVSGAFLLGVAVGTAVHGDRYSLVATGLLGSYTTFSTWVFDSHASPATAVAGRPRSTSRRASRSACWRSGSAVSSAACSRGAS